MIKEAFGEGPTYEDAQKAAREALDVDEAADVRFEIIEMPRKKVLGMFGGSLAKVKAFCEVPDETAHDKPTPVNLPTRQTEIGANMAGEPSARAGESPSGKEYTSLPTDSPAYRACEYLRSVVSLLGVGNISLKVTDIPNGCRVDLNGTGLGSVIGRRGETSDALQYLASLAAKPGKGGFYRVILDVGNYRERREASLKDLARRTAEQCRRTHRSRTLEPMNPYERRIIHTAVQEISGVTSFSTGEGASRRVVISVEGSSSGEFEDKGEMSPRPLIKDGDSLPLYGKIR